MEDNIYQQVNLIYPNGIARANNFFATKAVQRLGLTYKEIRKLTHYNITNRGAWLRFLGKCSDEEVPGRKDDNVEYVQLEAAGLLSGGEAQDMSWTDDETGEYYQAYTSSQFDKIVLRMHAGLKWVGKPKEYSHKYGNTLF